MQTKSLLTFFQFSIGFILFIGFLACEKEEIEGNDEHGTDDLEGIWKIEKHTNKIIYSNYTEITNFPTDDNRQLYICLDQGVIRRYMEYNHNNPSSAYYDFCPASDINLDDAENNNNIIISIKKEGDNQATITVTDNQNFSETYKGIRYNDFNEDNAINNCKISIISLNDNIEAYFPRKFFGKTYKLGINPGTVYQIDIDGLEIGQASIYGRVDPSENYYWHGNNSYEISRISIDNSSPFVVEYDTILIRIINWEENEQTINLIAKESDVNYSLNETNTNGTMENPYIINLNETISNEMPDNTTFNYYAIRTSPLTDYTVEFKADNIAYFQVSTDPDYVYEIIREEARDEKIEFSFKSVTDVSFFFVNGFSGTDYEFTIKEK